MPGHGKLLVNAPALDKLQALHDQLGKPVIVRSAYRSPEHNRAVGGAARRVRHCPDAERLRCPCAIRLKLSECSVLTS